MTHGASSTDNGDAGVLVCDDNAAMRALLGLIVESASGLRLAGEAADGREAIDAAARLQPAVITLDLAMPSVSGLDALPELRRVAPDAQIIVFSGFASATVAEDVLALGAACYLEKGAHPDTIVATLEQTLARFRASNVPATLAAPG